MILQCLCHDIVLWETEVTSLKAARERIHRSIDADATGYRVITDDGELVCETSVE